MSDLLTVLAIVGCTVLVCWAWNGVLWLGDWLYLRWLAWLPRTHNAIPTYSGPRVLRSVVRESRKGGPVKWEDVLE